MVDDLAPSLGDLESQDPFHKAREILDGLAERRIDRSRVKMIEPEHRAKGGQATISVGTIILPEEAATWIPEQLLTKLLGLQVAIKKFEWDCADAEQSGRFFKSFVNELSVMASISHPNVVKIFGFVEDMDKGVAWILSPWQPNGNVREFLQSGEWDIPERISLIQDVVNGVEYLHSREPPVCHGDLKSLNILVNSSYRAVITDFGSARIKPRVGTAVKGSVSEVPHPVPNDEEAERLTSPKIKLKGTILELTLTDPGFSLRWAAPEVLDNGVQEMPSDMWAVGWICWEIMTGKLPFEELLGQGGIIHRVVKGELPAIRVDAQLSQIRLLCALISDCWCLRPVKRIDASTFQLKPSTAPSNSTAGGAKVRSAALLLNLGVMYALRGHTRMAESHYQSAVDLASRTGDVALEADALNRLGETYYIHNGAQEGEELWKKAYEISSRVGYHLGMANALNSLGRLYFILSRGEEAEKAFREAHDIHSRIGSGLGEAIALNGLGGIYRARSEFREAEKAFKEAHEIQCLLGDDMGAVGTLDSLGKFYFAQSRFQETEKVLIEAHQISSHIDYEIDAMERLQHLGAAYVVQSRYEEAEKTFRELHELGSSTGDERHAADGLLNLGEIHRARGHITDAEKAFRQAYEMNSHSGGDEIRVARALSGLGELYRIQSRYQEAEKTLREAHEICSRIGNEAGVANALDNLGDIYCAQSRYEEAEKALREAYEIHSRIGFRDSELAATLTHMGRLYSIQSRFQESENAFRRAHEISSRIGSEHCVADALFGLGEIDRKRLRYQEAEKAFKTAYDIYSRLDDSIGIGMVLGGFGMLRHAQCRYDEMETFCSKALSVDPRADGGPIRAGLLLQLGNAQLAQHKYTEAEEALTESLAIFTSMGDDHQASISSLILVCQSKNPKLVELMVQVQTRAFAAGRDGRHGALLHSQGREYLAHGMYAEAEECYHLAQAIHLSVGNVHEEAIELLSLGELYICQDQYGEAEECFVQARAAFASCADQAGEAQSLDGLMTVCALQGKVGDVRVACMDACQIYMRTGRTMSKACAMTCKFFQLLKK
ncbi:hypothetical protein M407DRAFT_31626 [Tulasnella calospora MUT 4182]|uniref:Protein kinase domain-containing protein n=1 Tax=Tulasnella calospora MUT 4182 TaxID=1051891 RepID=A0A0C3KB91_9AGAM|nr:hypothetical protein M407DRAFT_31626 [Tulasnella calospora MUT 4182]